MQLPCMRWFVNRLKEGGRAVEPPIKATSMVAKGREEKGGGGREEEDKE